MARKSASKKSASKCASKKSVDGKCVLVANKHKEGDRKTLKNGAVGEYYMRKSKLGTEYLAFKIVSGPTQPRVSKKTKTHTKSPTKKSH